MIEPTLAEMIQDWRTTVARSDESTDDVYDRCADDLTAFHARAKALAETLGCTCEYQAQATSERACLTHKLLAILGDLQP